MVVFKFHRAKGCLIQDCECPAFQEGRLLGANGRLGRCRAVRKISIRTGVGCSVPLLSLWVRSEAMAQVDVWWEVLAGRDLLWRDALRVPSSLDGIGPTDKMGLARSEHA